MDLGEIVAGGDKVLAERGVGFDNGVFIIVFFSVILSIDLLLCLDLLTAFLVVVVGLGGFFRSKLLSMPWNIEFGTDSDLPSFFL